MFPLKDVNLICKKSKVEQSWMKCTSIIWDLINFKSTLSNWIFKTNQITKNQMNIPLCISKKIYCQSLLLTHFLNKNRIIILIVHKKIKLANWSLFLIIEIKQFLNTDATFLTLRYWGKFEIYVFFNSNRTSLG